MTRFARAEGSKACNKRVVEDATPWSELKQIKSNKPNSSEPSNTKPKIQWKGAASDAIEEFASNSTNTKKRKNEHNRQKPTSEYPSFVKNGKELNIVRFEGFPVRKEDAEKLKEIKKKLLAEKVPHREIKERMKFERRRAEKALSRDKKIVCFQCRQPGHVLSQCPNLNNEDELTSLDSSVMCFKCGSLEHQHTDCKIKKDVYKFATCFICKETGHISKQCPDNPKGLFPEGGGCRICGDVTHMKKHCPTFGKKKKEDFDVTVKRLNTRNLDALDDDLEETRIKKSQPPAKKKKIIKM